MGYYGLINSNGIYIRECNQEFQPWQIASLVGKVGESAEIEITPYRTYSDTDIRIVCDPDALRKGYETTFCTSEGYLLAGQLVIMSLNKDGSRLCLLNKAQAEIIKTESRLNHESRLIYITPPKWGT